VKTRRGVLVASAVLGLIAPVGLTPTAQAEGITFISFDDVPASCAFAEVTALRGRYSAVKFTGPAAKDGGAVLDNCAGFGIAPRTGSRFLAFNKAIALSDDGVPRGPETMRLVTHPKVIEIWVSTGGSETTGTFTLKGKYKGKTVQAASVSVTAQGWNRLRVKNKKGLTQAVLSSSVSVWVADDLTLTD
jgi:hypothetical protein